MLRGLPEGPHLYSDSSVSLWRGAPAPVCCCGPVAPLPGLPVPRGHPARYYCTPRMAGGASLGHGAPWRGLTNIGADRPRLFGAVVHFDDFDLVC